MPPAARVTDTVSHPLPPILGPGPGSPNVLTGSLPQWRAAPSAAVSALQAAKKVSDAAVKAADTAADAAKGTPAAPAAIAAAEATKAAALSTMSSLITSSAMGADIHICATPFPTPPHGPGVVIDGSPTVLINNLPAARTGNTVLEALGPPNKITGGLPTVMIGEKAGTGSEGLMALLASIVSLAAATLKPVFPRTARLPDGSIATEYLANVFVVGTQESQLERINQLNAVLQGPGGPEFFSALAERDEPQIITIIGNPARGRELHPGQQSYQNCAVQSSQQIIHQATDVNHDEATMEDIAQNPRPSGYSRTNGTPIGGEEIILENGDVPAHMAPGNSNSVVSALAVGQGVVSGHDAGRLWNDPAYADGGHAVHTTGAIQNQNGETLAYTINDTGTDENGRVIDASEYANSMDGGNVAITDEPIW